MSLTAECPRAFGPIETYGDLSPSTLAAAGCPSADPTLPREYPDAPGPAMAYDPNFPAPGDGAGKAQVHYPRETHQEERTVEQEALEASARKRHLDALVRKVHGSKCTGHLYGVGAVPVHSFEDLCKPRSAYMQRWAVWPGRTPLTDKLFEPDNVRFIMQEIQRRLSEWTGQLVSVPIDEEFVDDMMDAALYNRGLAYTEVGLQAVSDVIVERTVRQQYYSLRQKMEYYRLFLDQDRIRTMPYGADSSHQRGEIAVVHSGYQLGHPWGDRQKQYLNDVFRAQQTCEAGRVGYY